MIAGKSCYAPSVYNPATTGRRATLAKPRPVAEKPNREEIRIRSQSAMHSLRRPETSRPDTKVSRPMTTHPASRLAREVDTRNDVVDDKNDANVGANDQKIANINDTYDAGEDSEKENKQNNGNFLFESCCRTKHALCISVICYTTAVIT